MNPAPPTYATSPPATRDITPLTNPTAGTARSYASRVGPTTPTIPPLPEPPWAALEVSLGVFGDHCASQAARNDGVWVDGP